MSERQIPSIEVIQGQHSAELDHQVPSPKRKRWVLFLLVFSLVILIGLTFTYSRDAVYRASATVLTVKPKAVDMRSEEADVQHVAIQERFLLENDLLLQVLEATSDDALDLIQLRKLLSVAEVVETNLVELRAEGEKPEQLALLVNNWAQAYQGFRARQIEQAKKSTTAELQDEQVKLQSQINKKQLEMKLFMEENDIVSLEREDNRVAAKLKGLNSSINRAREKLIEETAYQQSVEQAINRGDTVVPAEQRAPIKEKRLAAKQIQDRLSSLEQRFTQAYIERDPKLKELPIILKALEQDINNALILGRQAVLEDVQQRVEKARQTLHALEIELREHQNSAKEFSARFEEHKALLSGINQLQSLYDSNLERIAQIQIKNQKKYPPVQVVNWARVPEMPISPDYQRDALLSFGVALVTALFVTWLVEYLNGRGKGGTTPVTGVRIYTTGISGQSRALEREYQTPSLTMHETPSGLLNQEIQYQALDPSLLRLLIDSAAPTLRCSMILLLNGISPRDLLSLNIASENQVITVSQGESGEIQLTENSIKLIQQIKSDLMDFSVFQNIDELNTHLSIAAVDAGLEHPDTFNAENIWFSYVLYLVQQGARLSELSKRTGNLSTQMLAYLAQFSPPGKNHGLNEIEIEYPLFNEISA